MDAFCFNYQHLDCLYTLFKYRFGVKIVIKSGQHFDNLHGQFISTRKTEEWVVRVGAEVSREVEVPIY